MERRATVGHRIPCGKPFEVMYNKILFQSVKVT